MLVEEEVMAIETTYEINNRTWERLAQNTTDEVADRSISILLSHEYEQNGRSELAA